MPANAYRRLHLQQHLTRSYDGRSPELMRALLLHRGQPLCAAGCGWPLDPAAEAGGHTTHPGCDGKGPCREP